MPRRRRATTSTFSEQRSMTVQVTDSADNKSRSITALVFQGDPTLDHFTTEIERHVRNRYSVTSVNDQRHQRR